MNKKSKKPKVTKKPISLEEYKLTKQFIEDIETGRLYDELKPKDNAVKDNIKYTQNDD